MGGCTEPGNPHYIVVGIARAQYTHHRVRVRSQDNSTVLHSRPLRAARGARSSMEQRGRLHSATSLVLPPRTTLFAP